MTLCPAPYIYFWSICGIDQQYFVYLRLPHMLESNNYTQSTMTQQLSLCEFM